MLYKANVPLIVKGDYKRKGEEFELSVDEAKQFDPNDIIAVSAVLPEPEPKPEPDVPVDEMSFDQLRAKAKELGLSAAGSKADIEERIKLHMETEDAEETEEGEPSEETEDAEETEEGEPSEETEDAEETDN